MAPRPRFETVEPDRRAALFDAAMAEIAEHGVDGSSINRILDAAGVSKGAFYYWFDDKHDLVMTLVADIAERRLMDFDVDPTTFAADRFWDELLAWFGRAFDSARENPDMVKFGAALMQSGIDFMHDPALAEPMARVAGWFDGVLRRGQDLGLVRDDLPRDLMVHLLMAADMALDQYVLARHESMTAAELEAVPALYLDIFRRLVAAP